MSSSSWCLLARKALLADQQYLNVLNISFAIMHSGFCQLCKKSAVLPAIVHARIDAESFRTLPIEAFLKILERICSSMYQFYCSFSSPFSDSLIFYSRVPEMAGRWNKTICISSGSVLHAWYSKAASTNEDEPLQFMSRTGNYEIQDFLFLLRISRSKIIHAS